MVSKKRVTFTATKKMPRKRKVSFTTSEGEPVRFTATKKVPTDVKVSFLAKDRKRRKD